MQIDIYGHLNLTVQDTLEQLVAVLGIRGSGKSNTAAVLMEESLTAGVPIQVVDIAGEYWTLKERFARVQVVGRPLRAKPDVALTYSNAADVAQVTYTNGIPTVVDLSGVPSANRAELLFNYFMCIWRLAARERIPTLIFLEEAHNWIPQRKKTAVSELFVDIASEGRKRGLSAVLVTQRMARVDKDVLSQADVQFLHRVRASQDMKVYSELLGFPLARTRQMVSKLKTGEALVQQGDRAIKYIIRERRTRHPGGTPSLDNVPAPTQTSLLDLLAQHRDTQTADTLQENLEAR